MQPALHVKRNNLKAISFFFKLYNGYIIAKRGQPNRLIRVSLHKGLMRQPYDYLSNYKARVCGQNDITYVYFSWISMDSDSVGGKKYLKLISFHERSSQEITEMLEMDFDSDREFH